MPAAEARRNHFPPFWLQHHSADLALFAYRAISEAFGIFAYVTFASDQAIFFYRAISEAFAIICISIW